MLGTVRFFDEKHGYGFITCLGMEQDIFVHYSQIKLKGRKVLKPGQDVSFILVEGEKGPSAESVRLTEDPY
jgi:CspA family cold shock protein